MTSVSVARGPKNVKLFACNDGFTGTDVTDNRESQFVMLNASSMIIRSVAVVRLVRTGTGTHGLGSCLALSLKLAYHRNVFLTILLNLRTPYQQVQKCSIMTTLL